MTGLETEVLRKGFGKLSGEIATGGKILDELGIAYQTTGGHAMAVNEVILNAADYFHAHAGASNEAYIATQLFGKSGAELIPILEQGRAGIGKLTEELRKMGFVMDQETLNRNAAFAHELERVKLAAEGLAIRLGNALLPGIAALGQAILNNDGIINAWIAAINRAVSFVIGFVEGITGQTLAVSELSQQLGAVTDAAGAYGDAANLGGKAARNNTDAIDDQIAALRNQDAAMQAVIDDQIKQLQLEAQQEAFADKKKSLLQRKADDERRIAEDGVKYQQDLLSGNLNNLQGILDDARKAKEDEAKVDGEIAKATTDFKRNEEIRGLEAQKKERSKDFADQIKALEDAKKEMVKSAQAGVAGMGEAFGALPGMASKTGADMQKALKFAIVEGSENIGKEASKRIMGALFTPETGDEMNSSPGSNLDIKWSALGKAIGGAIADGAITVFGDKIKSYFHNDIDVSPGAQGLYGSSTAYGGNNPVQPRGGRAAGGPVQGGSSYLVGEQGPEVVTMGGNGHVTPNHQLGTTVIVHIDGAEVARAMSGQTQSRSRGVRMAFA